MKLYKSKFTQNAKNTLYEEEVNIDSLEELEAAAQYDHIAAEMKDSYRSNDNFIKSDCIMLDLDNSHSEDPEEWKTIKDISETFPDVKFYYIKSRNYLKEKTKVKDGETIHYAPREKYHCYFPLSRTYENEKEYNAALLKAAGLFPYFDRGAAKPAQFFYGVTAAAGGEESGDITLDTFLQSQTMETVKEAVKEFDNRYQDEITQDPDPMPEETDKSGSIDRAERNRSIYWLKEWTAKHNIKTNGSYEINTTSHPHAVCVRVSCPWESEHSMTGADNETVIIVDAGGKLNFLCRHSHGWKYNWKDYRAFYEDQDTPNIEPLQDLEDVKVIKEEDPREAYLQTSAGAHIQDFKDLVKINTPQIETGFQAIDYILDGGLYPGLYILGAMSSLGKTTFCLQLADNMAKKGQDVLFFSLEMSRTELMAKSISRLTYLHAEDERNAKTARQITNGSWYEKYTQLEKDLINTAEDAYSQYAGHIYIHEGMGNIGVEQIKKEIDKHISFTGKNPVVVLDYVQILAPNDPRATDKQNTDKNILELKRISRDYKIPVIGISSFNRESYRNDGGAKKGRVGMTDFKESGAVEYSADILLGLEFASAGDPDYSEKDEKQKDPREIKLVVLKNRYGKAWQSVKLKYKPRFDYFYSETDTDASDGFQEDGAGIPNIFLGIKPR